MPALAKPPPTVDRPIGPGAVDRNHLDICITQEPVNDPSAAWSKPRFDHDSQLHQRRSAHQAQVGCIHRID